jgi:prepilin-type N-terminal cleavage/methylation domain-containing protein
MKKLVSDDNLHPHGFTLVELMIAMFIFLVVMLGLAKGEIAALLTNTGNVFRDEALRLAEDELSRLKGLQFTVFGIADELEESDWALPKKISVPLRSSITTFTLASKIEDISSKSTSIKRIEVVVGWDQGKGAVLQPTGRNHQTSLSTIIAQSE